MKNSIRSKLSIFKPGVLFLLVFSAVVAMILAGGFAVPGVMLKTLIFGMIAGASANILNNYIDRDIDGIMDRTKDRPLPTGRIQPATALLTGALLGLMSIILFLLFINMLSAILTLGGILFYVLVYSAFLKKRTDQNIVLGGTAGIFPAMVGWAAVTNTLSLVPLFIGLLIILWTPPHFWALAIVHKSDYTRAKVPMLPSVAGIKETARQIFLYSFLLLSFSILFTFVAELSTVYLATAVILGFLQLLFASALSKTKKVADAKILFHYSLIYLVVIFAAIVIDFIQF